MVAVSSDVIAEHHDSGAPSSFVPSGLFGSSFSMLALARRVFFQVGLVSGDQGHAPVSAHGILRVGTC